MPLTNESQPLMLLLIPSLTSYAIQIHAFLLENLCPISLISQDKVREREIEDQVCFIHAVTFIELSIKPELINKLVPPHMEANLLAQGIDVHNFQPLTAAELKGKAPC